MEALGSKLRDIAMQASVRTYGLSTKALERVSNRMDTQLRNQYLLDGKTSKKENIGRRIRSLDADADKITYGASAVREFLQNTLDHMRPALVGIKVWKSHAEEKHAVDRINFGFEEEGILHAAFTITTYANTKASRTWVSIAQFGHPLSKDCMLTGTETKGLEDSEDDAGGFGDGFKTAGYKLVQLGMEPYFIFRGIHHHHARELAWRFKGETRDGYTEPQLVIKASWRKDITNCTAPIMITYIEVKEDQAELLANITTRAIACLSCVYDVNQSDPGSYLSFRQGCFTKCKNMTPIVDGISWRLTYSKTLIMLPIEFPFPYGAVVVAGILYPFPRDFHLSKGTVIFVPGKGTSTSMYMETTLFEDARRVISCVELGLAVCGFIQWVCCIGNASDKAALSRHLRVLLLQNNEEPTLFLDTEHTRPSFISQVTSSLRSQIHALVLGADYIVTSQSDVDRCRFFMMLLGDKRKVHVVDPDMFFREMFILHSLTDIRRTFDRSTAVPLMCKPFPEAMQPLVDYLLPHKQVFCFDSEMNDDVTVDHSRYINDTMMITPAVPLDILKAATYLNCDDTYERVLCFYAKFKARYIDTFVDIEAIKTAIAETKKEREEYDSFSVIEDCEEEDEETSNSILVDEQEQANGAKLTPALTSTNTNDAQCPSPSILHLSPTDTGDHAMQSVKSKRIRIIPAGFGQMAYDVMHECLGIGEVPQNKDLTYSAQYQMYLDTFSGHRDVATVSSVFLNRRKQFLQEAIGFVRRKIPESEEVELFPAFIPAATWMGFRRLHDGLIVINLAHNHSLEDFKVTIVHEMSHVASSFHGPRFLEKFETFMTKLLSE